MSKPFLLPPVRTPPSKSDEPEFEEEEEGGEFDGEESAEEEAEVLDRPPNIYTGDIEEMTKGNTIFRDVVVTEPHMQLVTMSLRPNQTIDFERHDGEQFIKIEKGAATVSQRLSDGRVGDASLLTGHFALIPTGVEHKVTAGENGAWLYTIYSPPQHSRGTKMVAKPNGD